MRFDASASRPRWPSVSFGALLACPNASFAHYDSLVDAFGQPDARRPSTPTQSRRRLAGGGLRRPSTRPPPTSGSTRPGSVWPSAPPTPRRRGPSSVYLDVIRTDDAGSLAPTASRPATTSTASARFRPVPWTWAPASRPRWPASAARSRAPIGRSCGGSGHTTPAARPGTSGSFCWLRSMPSTSRAATRPGRRSRPPSRRSSPGPIDRGRRHERTRPGRSIRGAAMTSIDLLPGAPRLRPAADLAAGDGAIPRRSSRTISRRQRPSREQLIGGAGGRGYRRTGRHLAPLATAIGLIALATLVYLAALVYRLAAFWLSLRNPEIVVVTDEEARSIPDELLPVYTILVPAYREPSVIAELIARLSELEYPRSKLDIRLLLEQDDRRRSRPRCGQPGPQFTIVRVPHSEPKTKPKACNYGLEGARGEYVTIYDAEDRPEPLQLRRAVVGLRTLGSSVACLQAKLSYYNAARTCSPAGSRSSTRCGSRSCCPAWWLSAVRCRSAEPRTTSAALRPAAVGGWDPYNVTEDADLGIRLARRGYQTRVLDSTTSKKPTATSSTGSSSGPAGTRATCRPGWSTPAPRAASPRAGLARLHRLQSLRRRNAAAVADQPRLLGPDGALVPGPPAGHPGAVPGVALLPEPGGVMVVGNFSLFYSWLVSAGWPGRGSSSLRRCSSRSTGP
jgi:hypothetical protein